MAHSLATFIEFTPPAIRRKLEKKKDDVPVFLVLAPFNPPAKIFFEEVKIQEKKSKIVTLRNPTSAPISVILSNLPDSNSGLSVSVTEFCVQPCGSYDLTISWQASKAESFRHIVFVKDAKKNRKISEIIVTATVVSPKKCRVNTKKIKPLRAKVVSSKLIITAPKIKSPRIPLKKKSPDNFQENTFIFPEKRVELAPLNMPTTPRRQTYDVENKENNSIQPSKNSKKSISSCRKTILMPTPTFDSRRRKVKPEPKTLEIETCLAFSENIHPVEPRRSTYLLKSQNNHLSDTFCRPKPLENITHERNEQTITFLTESNFSLNQKNLNSNIRADRFSLDSLNSNVDLSSGSSEVFSYARDSLEAQFNPTQLVERNSPVSKSISQSNFSSQSQPPDFLHLDFSPEFNFKRCTYTKNTPFTPAHTTGSPKLALRPKHNVSFTIIDDDEVDRCEESFDLKLNTPKIPDTPNYGNEKNSSSYDRNFNFNSPRNFSDQLKNFSEKSNGSAYLALNHNFQGDTKPSPDIFFSNNPPNLLKPRKSSSVVENELKSVVVSDTLIPSFTFKPVKEDFFDSLDVYINFAPKSEVESMSDFRKVNKSSPVFSSKPSNDKLESSINFYAPSSLNYSSKLNCKSEDDLENNVIPADKSPALNIQNNVAPLEIWAKGKLAEMNEQVVETSSPKQILSAATTNLATINEMESLESVDIPSDMPHILSVQNDVSSPSKTCMMKRETQVNELVLEISPPKKIRSCVTADLSLKKEKKLLNNVKPFRTLPKQIVMKSISSPVKVKRLVPAVKKNDIVPSHTSIKNAPVTNSKFLATGKFTSKRAPAVSKNCNIKSSFTGVPMSILKLKPTITESCTNAVTELKNKGNVSLKREKPVEFYNPDQYINSLARPSEFFFLFSSTSKTDPFIKSSLYYDPQWLDRQERDLIKWLNSLLTPPVELEANSDGHWRVDVAALWRKSQTHSKVTLAPSKETISSEYHTQKDRLDVLRKAALCLFTADSVAPVFSKLAVSINKKVISVRNDRDLHLDRGLQCKVLNLILCYNPLWLRIGLETIYGRSIPLHSNSDIIGLTSFIHKHFFSDPYLKKKFAHAQVPSLMLPGFEDAMKKFILRKFFMLVYFLDQAKTRKLIGHDPCLFVKNSPYKESRELVIEFAKELIAGLGDITKFLRSFGYVLYHKQTYLDEFDYAVKSRQDLRDGVRLTRVMEIILNAPALSSKLRTPAISRLQKKHNVEVALKALQSANYSIEGDISAIDIVDGHREKTLSLLWQIIYRFQAPRYKKAALQIWDWWKKNSLRFCIQKRILAKRLARRNNAASKIQSVWKGVLCRRRFQSLKEKLLEEKFKRAQAVVTIQKYWRKYRAQKAFNIMKQAIISIQKWYRSIRSRHELRMAFIRQRKACLTIQKYYRAKKLMEKDRQFYLTLKISTINIQRQYRRVQLVRSDRRNFLALRNAASLVKSKFLAIKAMKRDREEFIKLKQNVVFIQQRYRANVEAKKCFENFKKLKAATIFVQRTYKKNRSMKNQRQSYLNLRSSTICIQHHFRAYYLMKIQRNEFQSLKTSTIVIQSYFRSYLLKKSCRKEFLNLKKAAQTIQIYFRAFLAARLARRNYLELRNTVLFIQAKYRAKKAMMLHRNNYMNLKKATVFLQQKFRAKQLFTEHHTRFVELKCAAKLVQSKFRAKKSMRLEQEKFSLLKSKTIIIQRKYRAWRKMKECRNSYLKLQAVVKFVQKTFRNKLLTKHLRTDYLAVKSATIVIQRQFRALRLMKVQRQKYLRLKTSVKIIEEHYCAYTAMKTCRKEFLSIRGAAVIIQRRFKAKLACEEHRKNYLRLKSAVRFIQSAYRAKILMRENRKNYLALREAVIFIQRKFRANILRKKNRSRYLKLKQATKVIQSRFRANKSMKDQRKVFIELREKVIFVQQIYRANVKAKKCSEYYKKLRTATVLIQRTYRKNKTMRDCRSKYLSVRSSAVCIQRHFRANRLMKTQRGKYQLFKNSAVIIQTHFRAYLSMKYCRSQFLSYQKSAKTIQIHFRAYLVAKNARRDYLKLKNAVLLIQMKYRARKLMQSQRKNFLELRKSALYLQNKYRMKKLVEKHCLEFKKLKCAVQFVQSKFRANRLMQQERKAFILLKSKTIFIQQRFRANREMKKYRKSYLDLISAVIPIQRLFRTNRLSRRCRSEYLALKSSTIFIQRYFRGSRLMIVQRQKFLKLKKATVIIQRYYRAYLLMKSCKNTYQTIRNAVITIQQHFKVRLAAKLGKTSYSRSEYLEKTRAAVKIQALWRGYQSRKRIPPSLKNSSKNKNVKKLHENFTLQHRSIIAMDQIMSTKTDLQTLIACFLNLDTVTFLSPKLCEELAEEGLISIVYEHLLDANRSIPYQELCVACLKVLVNFAKYSLTASKLWEVTIALDGISLLFNFMKAYYGKNPELFCHAATLLWLFAHDPVKKKAILKNNLCTKTLIFTLEYFRKQVLKPDPKNKAKNLREKVFPSLIADWGLGIKPKVFENPLFCIQNLCKELKEQPRLSN